MKKLAVIGDPIEHSLSPFIHNAAIETAELSGRFEYFARRVPAGRLALWLDRVREENIAGFNVTMPHKVDIIPLLDGMSREAEFFHSVNTVVNREGRLFGHSTDAAGFASSLADAGESFGGRRVLLLGAGGVTNTLALRAAADEAERVTILNRTADKARQVCAMAAERAPGSTKLEFDALNASSLRERSTHADILINATPLGMSGISADFEAFDFLKALPRGTLVCDLIYNPSETALLRHARRLGLRTMNGLGMLLHQALLADELFFDIPLDKEKIKREVERRLLKS